jgi:hypothetical protein
MFARAATARWPPTRKELFQHGADPEVVGTDHCGFAGRLMLGNMPAVRRRYSAWLGDLQASLDPLHRVGKDQPAFSRAA